MTTAEQVELLKQIQKAKDESGDVDTGTPTIDTPPAEQPPAPAAAVPYTGTGEQTPQTPAVAFTGTGDQRPQATPAAPANLTESQLSQNPVYQQLMTTLGRINAPAPQPTTWQGQVGNLMQGFNRYGFMDPARAQALEMERQNQIRTGRQAQQQAVIEQLRMLQQQDYQNRQLQSEERYRQAGEEWKRSEAAHQRALEDAAAITPEIKNYNFYAKQTRDAGGTPMSIQEWESAKKPPPADKLATPKIQEYNFYADQEKAAGRTPDSFAVWDTKQANLRQPREPRPEYEWVTRNGKAIQIAKGTAQEGDIPYDMRGQRSLSDMSPNEANQTVRQARIRAESEARAQLRDAQAFAVNFPKSVGTTGDPYINIRTQQSAGGMLTNPTWGYKPVESIREDILNRELGDEYELYKRRIRGEKVTAPATTPAATQAAPSTATPMMPNLTNRTAGTIQSLRNILNRPSPAAQAMPPTLAPAPQLTAPRGQVTTQDAVQAQAKKRGITYDQMKTIVEANGITIQ